MDDEKVMYFDAPAGCVGIAMADKRVVYTGCTVHQEPARYREAEALTPFLREDFHFFFDDQDPGVELYAVPEVLVLGYDSAGGYFLTTCMDVRLEEDFPLFYFAADRVLYAVEGESSRLLTGEYRWRDRLRPSDAVRVYPSREAARKDFTIHDLNELNLPPEAL